MKEESQCGGGLWGIKVVVGSDPSRLWWRGRGRELFGERIGLFIRCEDDPRERQDRHGRKPALAPTSRRRRQRGQFVKEASGEPSQCSNGHVKSRKPECCDPKRKSGVAFLMVKAIYTMSTKALLSDKEAPSNMY